jgi:hypothetical protein
MKPQFYVILVALLLTAILLLWPRARDPRELTQPDVAPPPSTVERARPGSSRESSRLQDSDNARARLLAPESATIAVTPESPPEQTVAWQIARQEAMLKALQRHLESSETKWRTTGDAAERLTLESRIEILRSEFTNQQAELRRLKELPAADPHPVLTR